MAEEIGTRALRLKLPQFLGLHLRRVVHIEGIALLIDGRTRIAFAGAGAGGEDAVEAAGLRLYERGSLEVGKGLLERGQQCGILGIGFQGAGGGAQGLAGFLRRIAHGTRMRGLEQGMCGEQGSLGGGAVGLFDEMAGIADALHVEEFIVLLQTLVEVHEVLLVGRQPSNLGQGEHTRIELIFGLGKGGATFRPEVGLHTEAVVLLRGAERAHGIVGIDAIHAVDGSVAVTTEVGLVGTHARGGYLKEVKVERHVGNGNAAETLGRGFARCARPRHDNQGRLVGRLPMVLQFVPSDDLLAVVVLEPCAERFDQPRL